jgi:ankyrin repeat protein
MFQVGCVDALILGGASVPQAALLSACHSGHVNVVQRLLMVEGMHLGVVNDQGSDCLMLAAARGHGSGLLTRTLLALGMRVTGRQDLGGDNVLHHAARSGMGGAEAMSVLFESAEQDMVQGLCGCANNAGDIPLNVACRCGSESAVRVLLKAAPGTVNAREEGTGTTPLRLASSLGHNAVVKVLLRAGGSF